jgi:MYXO-CTERM domain-containing protein
MRMLERSNKAGGLAGLGLAGLGLAGSARR